MPRAVKGDTGRGTGNSVAAPFHDVRSVTACTAAAGTALVLVNVGNEAGEDLSPPPAHNPLMVT